jgi:hypothetical protein
LKEAADIFSYSIRTQVDSHVLLAIDEVNGAEEQPGLAPIKYPEESGLQGGIDDQMQPRAGRCPITSEPMSVGMPRRSVPGPNRLRKPLIEGRACELASLIKAMTQRRERQ